MFGAGMPAGGAMPTPAPMPMSMPTPPPPPSNTMATIQPPAPMGGGGNLLSKLFGAMFDPDGAALEMAQQGVSPEDFAKEMKPDNLAQVMQKQASPKTGAPVSGLFGNKPAIDRGLYARPDLDGSGGSATSATAPDLPQLMAPTVPPMQQAGTPQTLISPPVPPSISPIAPPSLGAPPMPPIAPPVAMPVPQPAGEVPIPISPPVVPPPAAIETPMPPVQPTISASGAGGFTPEGNVVPKLENRPARSKAGQALVKGMKPEIREHISSVSKQYGLDPNAMQTMAMIESGGNPNAKNPSGASGLYQFMPPTAKQYGLENPFDYKTSTDAAARLMVDNRKYLSKNLGREPTYGELYLAHQQGAGGALAMLKDPNARAIDVTKKQNILQNGGNENMTAGEFSSLWTSKFDEFGTSSEGGAGSSGMVAGTGGGDAWEGARGATSGMPAATGAEGEKEKSLSERLAEALKIPEGGSENKVDPPNALLPQRGSQFSPDANLMKLIMMMLMPGGGGGQIPSISGMMRGQGQSSGG